MNSKTVILLTKYSWIIFISKFYHLDYQFFDFIISLIDLLQY
jgi:hypothetical protein